MLIFIVLVHLIWCFDPPIMGWTTWCTDNWRHVIPCYDDYCDEKEILNVATFMKENLLEYGYEWVYLDDCWTAQERDPTTHELVADPKRFPNGITHLIDEIHKLGLKISLYTDIGTHTCRYGRPGAWPYFELDSQTYAKWNVDGIKVDWCNHDRSFTAQQLYSNFSRALESASGGKIHFALCEWGLDNVFNWASDPNFYTGNRMWRVGPDHMPLWYMKNGTQTPGAGGGTWNIIQRQKGLSKYAHSGAWNDPDFLMLGYIWQGRAQQRSEFSFWCLFNAPLLVATDVRNLHDKPEMLNKDAIAVNQDPLGEAGDIRMETKDGGQVWSKRLSTGEHAVILFNMNGFLEIKEEFLDIQVSFDHAILPGWPVGCKKAEVYDIWENKSLGVFEDKFVGKKIIVRGSRFLRLKPVCS